MAYEPINVLTVRRAPSNLSYSVGSWQDDVQKYGSKAADVFTDLFGKKSSDTPKDSGGGGGGGGGGPPVRPPSSGPDTTTLILGGVAVVGLLAVVAFTRKKK